MLKSITVTNAAGQSLKLELAYPWDSRVIVKSIDGLTPTKGTINTNALATSDGSVYNSARQEQRNLVLNLRLLEDLEDGLIETTRQKLYKYFPVKKKVTIRAEADNRVAYTEGYVETNEPSIFQEYEEQQISIICPNANWTAPSSTYRLNGLDSLFEFPFSNESLEDDLLIFGEIIYYIGTTFVYEGDVESGVVMTIHCTTGECTNPCVYNVITKEEMTFNTGKLGTIIGDGVNGMQAGDTLICSTVDGDPYVTFIRNGVEYNAIAMLPKISNWLKVQAGYNAFGYKADAGSTNIEIVVQTQILYGGI